MSAFSVVLVTCSNRKESRKIARVLLESKLAACVNIVPGVESRYWWKEKIESAQEFLLMIKTRKSLLKAVARKVKSAHSYTVPEIIALNIDSGSRAYLDWMGQAL